MKVFYCHEFVLPLPEGHRFPMEKYALLYAAVVRAAADRPELEIELDVPAAATVEQLHRVHTAEYIDAVFQGALTPAQVREIGFPWSPELVERSRRSVGGTIAAARAALRDGAAANLAGGTHHARPDRGAGFCVFNDIAVAARDVQAEGLAQRVLVLDLDVHQGEGTAAIFARDPTVRTVSVHGANNYPFRKEQSDVDVALPDGVGDEAYLDAVRQALAAGLRGFAPDLVFYLAGADPYASDALGRLGVTEQGLAARDALVRDAAWGPGPAGREGTASRPETASRSETAPRSKTAPRAETALLPDASLAVVMGGGYAPDIHRTVAIHARSVLMASEVAAEVAAGVASAAGVQGPTPGSPDTPGSRPAPRPPR